MTCWVSYRFSPEAREVFRDYVERGMRFAELVRSRIAADVDA